MKYLNHEISHLVSDIGPRNILIEIGYLRRILRNLRVPFTAQELSKMRTEIKRKCQ